MKLRDWLRKSKMSDAEFARRINRHPAMVLHLAAGTRRPSLETIEAIARETGGAVMANDWVGIAKPKKKARARKPGPHPSKPLVAA